MRLRILTDLFRQKFVCKTLKYTEYSYGFTPFSNEKPLARLSCRFVQYCPKLALFYESIIYNLRHNIKHRKRETVTTYLRNRFSQYNNLIYSVSRRY